MKMLFAKPLSIANYWRRRKQRPVHGSMLIGTEGLSPRSKRLCRTILISLAAIVWMITPNFLASAPQQKGETFEQLTDRAKAASERNQLDEAAHLYRRALAFRPRWAEGWWALGTIEYDQDQ